ncbi:MAG: hypothetical protein R3D29_03865 [Nitratireductor sp.]
MTSHPRILDDVVMAQVMFPISTAMSLVAAGISTRSVAISSAAFGAGLAERC